LGFYIRKSVKAGPFRFNLSKSGIGVSAGIPGFRVGTGPRGNYVHMGRNGIYYRASLGPRRPRSSSPRLGNAVQYQQSVYRPSAVVMQDVTGATAMALEPTGRGDIVEQLNTAAARFTWWWPVAIVVFVLGLLTMPWGSIIWVLGVAGCVWLYLNDQARRTVVLFYDVDDGAHAWFESLVTSWRWLTESQGLWRVVQSGDVVGTYNFKVNSGASTLVNTVRAVADTSGEVKQLATNITVPSITAGTSALYFLPDRLLIRDGKQYSDLDYQALRVFNEKKRFIETSAPPRDSVQVDQTWEYVNVKGGPDRRFKNNPMRPIMLYGRLVLASASGLYWIVQVSRADAAEGVAQVISAAPKEPIPPPASATPSEPAQRVSGPNRTTKVKCFKCEHTQQVSIEATTFHCEQCGTKLKRVVNHSR
jgi:hypothetical protein